MSYFAIDSYSKTGLKSTNFAHEEAVSSQRSAFSKNQNQHQQQKPFTAKGAEDAKESQGLSLMNTDDTDKRSLPRINADDCGLEAGLGQTHAKLGCGGMSREGGRAGAERAYRGDPRSRKGNPGDVTAINADDRGLEVGLGQSHAKLGCGGMSREGGREAQIG